MWFLIVLLGVVISSITGYSPLCVMAPLIGIVGLFTPKFVRYATLVSSDSSVWQRLSVFGIPIHTWQYADPAPLNFHPPNSGQPDLPFSIAALVGDDLGRIESSRTQRAITLIQSALFDLARRGYVRLIRTQEYASEAVSAPRMSSGELAGIPRGIERIKCLVARGDVSASGEIGRLEQELLSVTYKVPYPLPVFQVVYDLYNRDTPEPAEWIIEKVTRDAKERGTDHKPQSMAGSNVSETRSSQLDAMVAGSQLVRIVWMDLQNREPRSVASMAQEIGEAMTARQTKEWFF